MVDIPDTFTLKMLQQKTKDSVLGVFGFTVLTVLFGIAGFLPPLTLQAVALFVGFPVVFEVLLRSQASIKNQLQKRWNVSFDWFDANYHGLLSVYLLPFVVFALGKFGTTTRLTAANFFKLLYFYSLAFLIFILVGTVYFVATSVEGYKDMPFHWQALFVTAVMGAVPFAVVYAAVNNEAIISGVKTVGSIVGGVM